MSNTTVTDSELVKIFAVKLENAEKENKRLHEIVRLQDELIDHCQIRKVNTYEASRYADLKDRIQLQKNYLNNL